MILLVTGSRGWPDDGRVRRELQTFVASGVRHVVLGDCPTGADRWARQACRELGLPALVCQANWLTLGNGAGPERNTRMVKVAKRLAEPGEELICLAFPLGESKGTRDCMRKARAAGFSVEENEP